MSSRLVDIARNLQQGEDGIWQAPGEPVVSYPESGHNDCFAVEEDSFWFAHRNRCITNLTRRYPPAGHGEILDIGGGNGIVSLALHLDGQRVALLEPGARGARHAAGRGVPTVIRATLESAGFPDHSIPAAGLFDVLEHIERPSLFLQGLRGKLDPTGRLYLTVPAYQALWSAEDVAAGHYRRYRERELAKTLWDAGFELEYSTYLFWFLPAPIFLLRALPYRLGLTRSRRSTEAVTRDHAARPGAISALLHALLSPEAGWLERGHRLPIGGSCLVCARPTGHS